MRKRMMLLSSLYLCCFSSPHSLTLPPSLSFSLLLRSLSLYLSLPTLCLCLCASLSLSLFLLSLSPSRFLPPLRDYQSRLRSRQRVRLERLHRSSFAICLQLLRQATSLLLACALDRYNAGGSQSKKLLQVLGMHFQDIYEVDSCCAVSSPSPTDSGVFPPSSLPMLLHWAAWAADPRVRVEDDQGLRGAGSVRPCGSHTSDRCHRECIHCVRHAKRSVAEMPLPSPFLFPPSS